MATALLILVLAISCSVAYGGIHGFAKNETTGIYCLVLETARLSGTVTYFDTSKNATEKYSFNANETTINNTGKCAGEKETLRIGFVPENINIPTPVKGQWELLLTFAEQDGQKGSFKIADYKLDAIFYSGAFNVSKQMEDQVIPYGKGQGTEQEWSATETNGFTCSNSGLNLVNDSSVVFTNLKVIAFTSLPKDQFPEAQLFEQCKNDVRTSDLIPIIVGACLAGLVIVVLVAYLVGRARAKRQGYASV